MVGLKDSQKVAALGKMTVAQLVVERAAELDNLKAVLMVGK